MKIKSFLTKKLWKKKVWHVLVVLYIVGAVNESKLSLILATASMNIIKSK